MSDTLALKPRLPGETSTVEGRLADIIECETDLCDIYVVSKDAPITDGYKLSDEDRALVVAALRAAHAIKAPYCAFCKIHHVGGDTCMGHHP